MDHFAAMSFAYLDRVSYLVVGASQSTDFVCDSDYDSVTICFGMDFTLITIMHI